MEIFMNKVLAGKANVYKMDSLSGLDLLNDNNEEKTNTYKKNHEFMHSSADQLLDLILSNSNLIQNAAKLAKEYNLDESQILNYLAVSLLDSLGNEYPTQQTIDAVESIVSDFYASKAHSIESILAFL
jgi:hypothetical protein